MKNSNWDVQNWVTGNANDGFVYDGCAAFQKVLDGKTVLISCQPIGYTVVGDGYWQKFVTNITILPISIKPLTGSIFKAIRPWGIEYTRRCGKGYDRNWFEKMWKKTVKYFDRALPDKLEGVFQDVGGCDFKHGFE